MHAKNHVVTNNSSATSSTVIVQVDEQTLNRDVIDACKNRRWYCYAPWKGRVDLREPFHGPRRTFDLLGLLFRCLHPDSNKHLSLQIRRWEHAL